MPITLLCLVKGNTLVNAFPVHIDGSSLVGDFKKIPNDQDDLLGNLTFNDGDELLAMKKILKYFPDSPSEEHIYIIVSPSEATPTSSCEQELLDQVASLQALLVHTWYIYHLPALENDGAKLNLMNDGEKYFPHNDQDLCEMFCIFVSKNNLKFTVFIETPSKAFLDWSFLKVCQLYELCESDDPLLSVFPSFTCEYKDLENDSSQAILKHLIVELNARLKSIPISGNEVSKLQHEPVDFAIDLLQTAKTVSVTECKASEMEESDMFTEKTFGIITDAEKWYFMECSYNKEKLSFKLSKPVTVVYNDKDLQAKVKKVLGHIAWLLGEVQKPDSDS
ncbi:hypothetical protein GLOIN_2v1580557 [Rhizophagus clarus]|uniref:Crinkler effector protein N-terminal domain-containing protein n=1 Tax=Rhizophagus clarus TaxID=94130 RepID=A0A8H3QS21_9GLOM|nr:hypothetical protein GLOIN_2v1580557 [Rhizophagus clarus]